MSYYSYRAVSAIAIDIGCVMLIPLGPVVALIHVGKLIDTLLIAPRNPGILCSADLKTESIGYSINPMLILAERKRYHRGRIY